MSVIHFPFVENTVFQKRVRGKWVCDALNKEFEELVSLLSERYILIGEPKTTEIQKDTVQEQVIEFGFSHPSIPVVFIYLKFTLKIKNRKYSASIQLEFGRYLLEYGNRRIRPFIENHKFLKAFRIVKESVIKPHGLTITIFPFADNHRGKKPCFPDLIGSWKK